MIFVALAVLMVLLAAAAVAVPLWRGAAAAAPADTADATHSLQLEELERDLASGALAESDYLAARRDMQAEFTHHDAGRRGAAGKGWRRGSALAALLFVFITAPLLYWKYGSWRSGVEGVEQASVPAVEQMVAGLAERLHSTDGNDLQGWVMLGHSYVIMGRYTDALDAYTHAHSLAGDSNPDVLSGYAEAITLADPSNFMDQALPLFERVLKLDAANPQGLWYGGLGAFERGDKKLAVARWQALLKQDPPAEYRQVIEKYIVAAGGKVASPTQSAAVAGAGIRIHVSLAPGLSSQVRPDETLFVFALPVGGAGGPPLAARRLQVGDLPVDLTLSDQDSPIPGRTLSGQAHVLVMARISVSGTPEQQAGDLVGQAEWDAASGKPVTIIIDTQVK